MRPRSIFSPGIGVSEASTGWAISPSLIEHATGEPAGVVCERAGRLACRRVAREVRACVGSSPAPVPDGASRAALSGKAVGGETASIGSSASCSWSPQ